MIGLLFLMSAALWTVFSLYIAINAPRWLGLKTLVGRIPTTGLILALLLVGPFIDEIIGMSQFKTLCKARNFITISPNASIVKKAKAEDLPNIKLTGYFVEIEAQQVSYIDTATQTPFLSLQILHTKGGRIGRYIRLNNTVSCKPSDMSKVYRALDIDKLVGL